MRQIKIGKVCLTDGGTWNSTTGYSDLVYVRHNGDGWWSKKANINSEPSSSNPNWIQATNVQEFIASLQTATTNANQINNICQAAEEIRKTSETARIANENERKENETTRKQNESNRVATENIRVSAESTRQSNETARINAESQRNSRYETAEASRNTTFNASEASRTSTFNANEATRQSNETTRQSNEATRQSTFEVAMASVETATGLANTAASEADTQADYAKEQGDYAKEEGDKASVLNDTVAEHTTKLSELGEDIEETNDRLAEIKDGGTFITINDIEASAIAVGALIKKTTSRLETASTTNVAYYTIQSGKTYNIHIPKTCSSYNVVYAFAKVLYKPADTNYVYKPDTYISGTSAEYSFELNVDTEITETKGYKYLIVSYVTESGSPTCKEASVDEVDSLLNRDRAVKSNTERIEALEESASTNERYESVLGSDGLRVTAASLTDGQSIALNDYPQSNKVGDRYAVHAYVTTFDKLLICQGHEENKDYSNYWFEIDNTNITLYSSKGTTTEQKDQFAHGLTIERFISANVVIDDDGKAIVTISTLEGSVSHTFDTWSADCSGLAQIISSGSSLTNVTYTATNSMFKCPLWIFGASQESFTLPQRYIYQLRAMGYKNFLVNAYAGRTSAGILADLRKALNFGCPKYLYFALSNDGYSYETYKGRMDAAKELADEYGIEIIFVCKAVTPDADKPVADQLLKRNTVINYGCRYWDFGKAVSDNPEDAAAIYPNYLDSEYVHPKTEIAGKAIAMSMLTDIPEVMQY